MRSLRLKISDLLETAAPLLARLVPRTEMDEPFLKALELHQQKGGGQR